MGDESGWKQIHGDVFRAPPRLLLFSALVGTGHQLSLLVFSVIIFSMIGTYYRTYDLFKTWSYFNYVNHHHTDVDPCWLHSSSYMPSPLSLEDMALEVSMLAMEVHTFFFCLIIIINMLIMIIRKTLDQVHVGHWWTFPRIMFPFGIRFELHCHWIWNPRCLPCRNRRTWLTIKTIIR